MNRKVKYDACGEVTSVSEVEQQESQSQTKTEPTEEYVKPVPVAEKVGRYMKDMVYFITSVSTCKLFKSYNY